MLLGDNGMLNKVKTAVYKYSEKKMIEQIELMIGEMKIKKNSSEESEEELLRNILISNDNDAKIEKTSSVYEITYKGKTFLLSNDFEYIPLVEPKNTNEWTYTNDGTITKYIGTNTDVIIPNYINGIRMKKIGFRIFYGSTIKRLNISNGIEEISYLGFQYGLGELEGDLVIPDSIVSLPSGCGFTNCSATGKLVLSKNLITIGQAVFYGCNNLIGNLLIPDSVEEIGSYAFCGCSSLNGELKMGKNVKSIGDRAFRDCSSLHGDIVMPTSLDTIEWEAFRACNSINSITLLNKDTVLGEGALGPINVIKGYSNSTAQEYAKKYKRTFIEIPSV